LSKQKPKMPTHTSYQEALHHDTLLQHDLPVLSETFWWLLLLHRPLGHWIVSFPAKEEQQVRRGTYSKCKHQLVLCPALCPLPRASCVFVSHGWVSISWCLQCRQQCQLLTGVKGQQTSMSSARSFWALILESIEAQGLALWRASRLKGWLCGEHPGSRAGSVAPFQTVGSEAHTASSSVEGGQHWSLSKPMMAESGRIHGYAQSSSCELISHVCSPLQVWLVPWWFTSLNKFGMSQPVLANMSEFFSTCFCVSRSWRLEVRTPNTQESQQKTTEQKVLCVHPVISWVAFTWWHSPTGDTQLF
jgi:hypothetical protein